MRIFPCHSFFLLPQWIKKNRYYLSISPYNRSYRRKGNETRILQGVQVLTKGYIKNNSSFQSTEERPLPYRVSAYSCFLLSGVKTVEQWVPLDCAFMTSYWILINPLALGFLFAIRSHIPGFIHRTFIIFSMLLDAVYMTF